MSILHQIPILIVVVLLIASPLCVLINKPKPAWALYMAVNIFNVVASILLLTYAYSGKVLHYHIGGWPPPYGIAYQVDAFSALMATLFTVVFLVVGYFIPATLKSELPKSRPAIVFAVLLIMQSGFLGITMSNDIFNIFVFLELASLSSYGLLASNTHLKSLTAAFRYLLLGSVGSGFLLLGIGCLYLLTGTLNLNDLSAKLPLLIHQPVALAGIAFICIGLFVKSGVFPLQQWLPDIYQHSPTSFVSIMSAVSSKIALYVLIRLLFGLFTFQPLGPALAAVLFVLAAASIIFGSLMALHQSNVLRMMAYSSIAQIGLIFLGLSLLTPDGVKASIIHIINHGIMKCGLFVALCFLALRLGGCEFRQLRGLAATSPAAAALILIGGLGLIGVPFTPGFISKWYLVSATIEQSAWLHMAVVVLGSLLSALYVWKLAENMYLQQPATPQPPPTAYSARQSLQGSADKRVLYACLAITILGLGIGVWPKWLEKTAATITSGWFVGVQ